MRRALTWLALGLVLALAIASALAAAPAPPVPGVVHAAAVNLNLNYSDPASDVFQMWTSNGSHVTDASGYWVMSPSPKEVNLIRLGSTDAGTSVDLYLKVQTLIASRPNVTYDIRMYSRADNQTHYIFEYSFGRAILTQNREANLLGNVHGGEIMKLADTPAGAVAQRHSRGPAVTVPPSGLNAGRRRPSASSPAPSWARGAVAGSLRDTNSRRVAAPSGGAKLVRRNATASASRRTDGT